MVFEVDEYGTLRMTDFEEAKTRSDFYSEDISTDWSLSPEDLHAAMEQCVPLACWVQHIYWKFRDEVLSDLERMEKAGIWHEQKIEAQRELLAQLPEEPEDGVGPWLEKMSEAEFNDRIVPQINKWFDGEPDWNFESEYLPQVGTAVGAAFEYFRDMSAEDLDKLGVQIVEGEHPGSSYYAAELTTTVEKANQAAEVMGSPARFAKA